MLVNLPAWVSYKVEGYSCPKHDDLARLVVDVEHSNFLYTLFISLGHHGNQSAQLKESQDLGPAHEEGCGGGNLQDREIFDSDAPLRSHVEELVWQELEEGSKAAQRKRDSGEELMVRGLVNKSTPRKSKKKGLWELGEPSTHPRRSIRISDRAARLRNSSYSAETPTTTISDGDIFNCNARIYDLEVVEESGMLWEVGKRMGVACRREEVEVVKEYKCMEVRDAECMQRFEEGKKPGFYVDL